MKTLKTIFAFSVLAGLAASLNAAEPATKVRVIDGVVQPKRPVLDAIADAMTFLKKADGSYVPGKTDGELAGYFTSAFVNSDGSRAKRQLAYPARQHAYFIFTFLNYGKYTGEKEWLQRARDLADWDLIHRTPATAFYANVPYSTYKDGKPMGGVDGDSIEPDKDAFIGSAYIKLYEATNEKKYLNAARDIATTLVKRQNKDGSWPFRVVPEDGTVRHEFGGAPVFYVQFFEDLMRHDKKPEYQKAHDKALQVMIDRNVKKNLWGIYHEDIKKKGDDKLSAEPMSFTAIYLFRNAKKHPEYLAMGRSVLRVLEGRLVHTTGHPAAPAPAVSEQEGFEHMMPGHTARYCLALAELYKDTNDEQVKKKALSGINALTFMQTDAGLFKTHFQLVNEKKNAKTRPDWYSQHLYTVCHVLEAMPLLPEISKEKGVGK
jgi:hypothetical protein